MRSGAEDPDVDEHLPSTVRDPDSIVADGTVRPIPSDPHPAGPDSTIQEERALNDPTTEPTVARPDAAAQGDVPVGDHHPLPSAAGPVEGGREHDTTWSGPDDDASKAARDTPPGGGAPAADAGHVAPMIPGYEILGELGRGGMGVVYKARALRLNRTVALKMILAGGHAGHEAAVRFLAEVVAVARLQHPNIVQIFHIGEHGGHPYYEMEFVAGGCLADRLDGTPRPAGEAARLVETLARAMAEAHRRGIVHRDLKPANILLTSDGVPKIADFGLAKLLGVNSGLTRTESILGSPSYMAPEQAEGHAREVGPAADVYALGAILYELLTGRPPFRGATLLETLHQVKTAEPVPPRRLLPALPRDLETITLKCLEKDLTRRYGSAEALAEDLARFVAGRPIAARPVGPAERTWRWCRRNPLAAALLATVAGLLVLAAGSAGLAARQYRQRAVLSQAAAVRERELRLGEQAAREEAEAARREESRARLEAETVSEVNRRNLYVARINLAHQAWGRGEPSRALGLLEELRPRPGQSDLRGFEWSYLWRLCHAERAALRGHTGRARCVVYAPDGRTLATAGEDGEIRLWEAGSARARTVLKGHVGEIAALAFSPAGALLASGGADRTVRLWDAKTGAGVGVLAGHGDMIRTLAFAPDSRVLASGTGKIATGLGTPLTRFLPASKLGEVRLWDVARRREKGTLQSSPRGVTALAFAPDGRTLAVAAQGEPVTLRDLTEDDPRPPRRLDPAVANVLCLQFAPDGRTLAAGSWEGHLALWETATWTLRVDPDRHQGPILALAFAPGGGTLATAGADQIVHLWDTRTLAERFALRGHADCVGAVAFAPDGASLATAGWDGLVKLWDARRRPEYDALVSDGYRLAFSPDSRVLASSSRALRLWEVATGRLLRVLETNPAGDVIVVFSPDGKTLATAGIDAKVKLWDTRTWSCRAVLTGHAAKVWTLAFSPDGRTLASGGGMPTTPGEIRLWDVDTGRPKATWRPGSYTVRALAFAPDGRRLAASFLFQGPPRPAVRFLDPESGRMIGELAAEVVVPDWVAFAPDGATIATGRSDRVVRLWDASTGRLRHVMPGHKTVIYHGTFAPDGKTLATASWDGTARLWHVATGQELLTLPAPGGLVWSVAFAPDGRTMAVGSGSGSQGGRVTLWWAAGPGDAGDLAAMGSGALDPPQASAGFQSPTKGPELPPDPFAR
jgi:WD40 repeat protein/tRNA A-37 threonylcarbamoyl transferase component Bud32